MATSVGAAIAVLCCLGLIALAVLLVVWAVQDGSWFFGLLAVIDGLVATYLLVAGWRQYRRTSESPPTVTD